MKVVNALKFAAVSAIVFMGALPAFAQEAAAASSDLKGFGAAIALGIAAVGGALGQGKAASAALEGIARNPAASNKIFVPMIIGLALIESLVIYTLIIAFKAV